MGDFPDARFYEPAQRGVEDIDGQLDSGMKIELPGLFRPLFASVDVHTIHTNTRHPLIRAGHLQDSRIVYL